MSSIIRAKFSIETQRMAKYRPPSESRTGLQSIQQEPLLSILHEGEIISIGRIPE